MIFIGGFGLVFFTFFFKTVECDKLDGWSRGEGLRQRLDLGVICRNEA